VAEVEAERRVGIGEHRLAALAETQLDRRRVLVEVSAQHAAQRPAGGARLETRLPDVHVGREAWL